MQSVVYFLSSLRPTIPNSVNRNVSSQPCELPDSYNTKIMLKKEGWYFKALAAFARLFAEVFIQLTVFAVTRFGIGQRLFLADDNRPHF